LFRRRQIHVGERRGLHTIHGRHIFHVAAADESTADAGDA
jgi:hypothetical protein